MTAPTIDEIRKKLKGRPEMVDQLPLLQACITTRWEVYAKIGYCLGVPECQLCEKFLVRGSPNCQGCVVVGATGKIGCAGTPYEIFGLAANFNREKEQKQSAVEELAFLRDIETVLIEMKE